MTLRFRPIDPVEAAVCRLSHFRNRALRVRTDLEADFAEYYGLLPGQARLLSILYEAQGPLHQSALRCAADLEGWSMGKYLASIREALGEGAIPKKSGEDTYELTQLGRAACDEAVDQVGLGRLRRELVG